MHWSASRLIWRETEYDSPGLYEPMYPPESVEKADQWFEDIVKLQGERHIRLGIFLSDGHPIGDVALQDIDWKNRSASIGMGLSKLAYRRKGYGREALRLMLSYGFTHVGLERVWATTLATNLPAQHSLAAAGFILEGREREAVWFDGRRVDRLSYGLLRREYAPD
jgi:RimJ/RimL family protein N-acetyltransferase